MKFVTSTITLRVFFVEIYIYFFYIENIKLYQLINNLWFYFKNIEKRNICKHDFYTSFTSKKKLQNIFLKLTSEYISFWNYLYITLCEIFCIKSKTRKKHTYSWFLYILYIYKKKLVISEYLFEIIQLNATNFFYYHEIW